MMYCILSAVYLRLTHKTDIDILRWSLIMKWESGGQLLY